MLRAVLVVGAVGAVEWPVWRNASDIPADPARRRLERNWAATGEGCAEARDAVAPLLRERSGFVAGGPLVIFPSPWLARPGSPLPGRP